MNMHTVHGNVSNVDTNPAAIAETGERTVV